MELVRPDDQLEHHKVVNQIAQHKTNANDKHPARNDWCRFDRCQRREEHDETNVAVMNADAASQGPYGGCRVPSGLRVPWAFLLS